MKPLQSEIEIEFDAGTFAALKRLCEKNNCSVDEYVNSVLKEHAEAFERENQLTF